MKQIQKIKLVSSPFSLRGLLDRVEWLYLRRVYCPIIRWQREGSVGSAPRRPWWQPFVYRFLVVVGRFRYQHLLARRRPGEAPQLGWVWCRLFVLEQPRMFVPSPAQQRQLALQGMLLRWQLRQQRERRQEWLRERRRRQAQPY